MSKIHEQHEAREKRRDFFGETYLSSYQIYNLPRVVSCKDVFCHCQTPQFMLCQKFCGCLTAALPGVGLQFCCCYGCARVDCPQVCGAGVAMCVTSPCIFGIVVGCKVGCQMMGVCNPKLIKDEEKEDGQQSI